MTKDIDIEKIREQLQKPLPGVAAQSRMSSRVGALPLNVPENARPSAVLSVFFYKEDTLHLLLIKRVADGKAHSGQVSFPGGKQDPQDTDLRTTALREANEEVGVLSSEVEIIGSLTPLYIPVSNFHVYPYVGYMPQQPVYNISEREVAAIIEMPVRELLSPGSKMITDVQSPVLNMVIKNVHAYRLADGDFIWGATAMIISELEELLGSVI